MVDTYKPKTLKEAIEIINKEDVLIYAGGTDIMVRRKNWAGVDPSFEKNVIFIGDLLELKKIKKDGDFLRIGAGEVQSDICLHKDIPEILREAVKNMSSPALRNIATIGGNICNASPAGDILPPLYCLDAKVVLESLAGKREIDIDKFIVSPGRTISHKNEILTEIIIPLKEFSKSYYRKIGTRKANAITKVSVTGYKIYHEDRLKEFSLSFGAVGPTIVRVKDIENKLLGKTKKEEIDMVDSIVSEYENYIKPIDDQRSTAEYRKKVALNLMKTFIKS